MNPALQLTGRECLMEFSPPFVLFCVPFQRLNILAASQHGFPRARLRVSPSPVPARRRHGEGFVALRQESALGARRITVAEAARRKPDGDYEEKHRR